MQKDTAELVYPIFRHGLRLKERLARGEKCDRRSEQAELKRLFRVSDWTAGHAPHRAPGTFLGIRYPLACWLDDIFILEADSPWKAEWKEESIEADLFGMRERFEEFWTQARLAESRADAEALEVFYLCVMLGFRGQLRDNLNALLDWRDSVEALIARGRPTDWPDKPPELTLAETNVPPLRARDQLRWVLVTGAAVLGLAILVTAFLVVQRFP